MPRPDANQLAFKAARTVLDAAHPFTFALADKTISVSVERLPRPSWPRPIADLDPELDGDWPAPVRVTCTTGAVDLELLVKVRLYTWGTRYKDHVSIGVYSSQPGRELLWINLANRLDEATEERPGIAQANSALIGKEDGEDVRALTRPLRAS